MRLATITLFGLFIAGVMAQARAEKPVGAPRSTPAEHAWFTQAYKNGSPCCDEADGFREGIYYPAYEGPSGHTHPEGIILRDWKASDVVPGEYDINILGKWMHVNKDVILPPLPANPTGGAVAFLSFNYTGYAYRTSNSTIYIRCFAPGNQF